MASITFTNFKKTVGVQQAPTYTDLHLDIAGAPIGVVRDIEVDTDLRAIKNSLTNLFNTVVGQKLLNPNYGLNLLHYLFEPVTTNTANIIGETIFNGITQFEPRVTFEKIKVIGNIDANEYDISLSISIPTLNPKSVIGLNAILSKNSNFTFV